MRSLPLSALLFLVGCTFAPANGMAPTTPFRVANIDYHFTDILSAQTVYTEFSGTNPEGGPVTGSVFGYEVVRKLGNNFIFGDVNGEIQDGSQTIYWSVYLGGGPSLSPFFVAPTLNTAKFFSSGQANLHVANADTGNATILVQSAQFDLTWTGTGEVNVITQERFLDIAHLGSSVTIDRQDQRFYSRPALLSGQIRIGDRTFTIGTTNFGEISAMRNAAFYFGK